MATQARSEILIGYAGPLSGPNSWMGATTQAGAEMAVADVNRTGGVLGQQLKLVAVDDFCDGGQAEAAAHKLIEAGVVFVTGHQCSGAAIPASSIYQAANIVMISSAATNPELTERGLRFVFRVTGRDDAQGTIAGDYLVDQWAEKTYAIIHDDQSYGQSIAEETYRRLTERGIDAESVLKESVATGQTDYLALITKLQQAEVDVVYFGGYAPEAGLLIRQARDHGADFQFVTGDGITDESFWMIAGAAAEGTLTTFYPDPRNHPETAELITRFQQSGVEPVGATFYSSATIEAWSKAVDIAGTTDAAAVAAALRNHQFDTVLGKIGFDG
jgi:branched-chain amino acid transport system substrate-binding protein